METVQLQCGSCRQVMAIGVEHLGGQVQCPHCQSVVQTPPRQSAGATIEVNQRESIFSGAEASDSVMGEDAAPKIEMPGQAEATLQLKSTAPASAPEPETDFTQFKRRPTYDRGVFTLILLIFLIPYAITMTGFVVYMYLNRPTATDPYEYLPDPAGAKDKGAPRPAQYQPKHDLPLAAHLKTTLGKSIRIGDLLVTPERVRLTAEGDLQLFLKAKNVSTNSAFDPINTTFVKYDPNKSSNKPYSFLEAKSMGENLYNFDLAYHRNALGQDEATGSGLLGPKADVYIKLMTFEKYRDKQVAEIVKSDDTYTWRVRLRRGFVKVKGKNVSATTVIGVEFSPSEIEREGKS